jgi:hypothetical protein
VHHTKAVGIYVDAWDKHTHNIEVFQNIVHDSANDGITLASEMGGLLENIRIYDNIVYNNSFLGISISRNGPDSVRVQPLHKIEVVNSTVYNNGLSGWGGGISIGNPDVQNVLIRNNICSQNLSFQLVTATDASSALTLDHNLIDGFRGYVEEGALEIRGTDYVEGDPHFVNPPEGDFRLQGNSAAIDKGSSDDAPTTDFEGRSRPEGTAYDIGAYEYGAGSPPTETVSTPVIPEGQAGGVPGDSFSYTTGGSASNLGHPVDYQFDWNGDASDLSPWGPSDQMKTWDTAGTYHVRARSRCQNDTGILSSWSVPLTVTISQSPLPDLTGEWTSLGQTCRNTRSGSKCKISGTLTVQNIGALNAPPTTVSFYLSEDKTYDEADRLLKPASTGKIRSESSKTLRLTHNLPPGDTAAGRYIIAIIDPYNDVEESSEDNNVIVWGLVEE